MDFDTHFTSSLFVNANLTCRLQEDQESVVSSDSDEEEEEVQKPMSGIGGGWRPWEEYPDITR